MTDSGLFCLDMSVVTVDNYSRAIIQNIIFVSPNQMSSSSLSSTTTAWTASWLGSFIDKLICTSQKKFIIDTLPLSSFEIFITKKFTFGIDIVEYA